MVVSGIGKNVSKELGGKCEEVNAAQRYVNCSYGT